MYWKFQSVVGTHKWKYNICLKIQNIGHKDLIFYKFLDDTQVHVYVRYEISIIN